MSSSTNVSLMLPTRTLTDTFTQPPGHNKQQGKKTKDLRGTNSPLHINTAHINTAHINTYSLRRLPWKKLAHSKQVFLLPTQKTEGMPTTSSIRYLMRNRARSGRLVLSTCSPPHGTQRQGIHIYPLHICSILHYI